MRACRDDTSITRKARGEPVRQDTEHSGLPPATEIQPTRPTRTFPADSRAVIYKPHRSPLTSGKAATRSWKLRFERRSAPYIEPLMGWTAGDDTLDQVELSFPTAEAAVAYARRRGLPYSITGWTPPRPDLSIVSATQDDDTRANPVRRKRLEWIERTLVADSVYRDAKPDVQPAFCKPRDVVDAPQLSFNDKRDALYRLAHESYLLERGRPVGDVASVSQLNDVIDALLDLEEAHQKGHCVASSHARKAA